MGTAIELKTKTFRIVRIVLIVVAFIAFLYGIKATRTATANKNHNPDKIVLKLSELSSEAKNSDSYSGKYYVYMDYEIENKTAAELKIVSAIITFSDKSGKEIMSVRGDFGSGSTLNIKKMSKGNSRIYLEKSISYADEDVGFMNLYNGNKDNYSITYKIVGVQWTDGYYYNNFGY
ncbi:MAG: hypothetical protein IJR89_04170 [Clostridia bacterium]|nr:hypothetical protein [Clostridia bacterium]